MEAGTRRLAAILFSDLVGYTARMGSDEPRTIAAVQRSRELQRACVARHRGEWLQEIGDGAVAIFGSAVDAVRCAFEIQREAEAVPDLEVRIGIHEGDIVVEGSDVFGDGVNVAARIQALAETGGICASQRVVDDVRNQPGVHVEPIGMPKLKGVHRPMRIFRLHEERPGARARGARLGRRGRALALAAALALLAGGALAALWASGLGPAWVARLIVRAPWLLGETPSQEIGFATSADGTRIAYATSGAGPAIVNVIGWFTHLERGLNSPAFSLAPRWQEDRLYVRYDGRGSGLSDRSVEDFSLAARVADLEAVVAALGLERFDVFAQSAGGPTAIAYAARHPERVARLVIYGSFARIADDEDRQELFASLVPVMRRGWGQDTPAFRQLFTSLFMPGRDAMTVEVFNQFQRLAATPEDAAGFLAALLTIDVRALAREVQAPTLVIHQRDDQLVPHRLGRELTTLIPKARLLTLGGQDHALSPSSPEGQRMLEAVEHFLAGPPPPAGAGSGIPGR